MADVRALLKAKRQEARVNHPLAAYSSTGQLRCIACGTVVKQAASWTGHVGSKSHRINAAKFREAEQARAEQERLQAKRKAEAMEVEDDDDDDVDMTPETKKQRLEEPDDDESIPQNPHPTRGFPNDFFSDPSKAPPPPSDDEEDGDPVAAQSAPQQPSIIDEEWEKFQREVLKPPVDEDRRDVFERATVIAEPVLADELPEGFPTSLAQDQGAAAVPQAELSEEEIRRRREQDDRELIMDRLMDEERAQEEADAKVSMLKSRLDALKRKREAAKAARTTKI
ncbi:hypothetical protein BXZ70DRAFT_366365 [Cristinia sonorae]|uniref:Coiled-coil domain-containing protein 16 n=1 Tax=Cristinia sonorae TaxID=1940300 RepID=A0A8K0XNE7_9AGAR|nr:hypothetical protein BXZ70DRAFT_366365 [Cristinia sonorae]